MAHTARSNTAPHVLEDAAGGSGRARLRQRAASGVTTALGLARIAAMKHAVAANRCHRARPRAAVGSEPLSHIASDMSVNHAATRPRCSETQATLSTCSGCTANSAAPAPTATADVTPTARSNRPTSRVFAACIITLTA